MRRSKRLVYIPLAAGRYVVDLHGATAAPVAVEGTHGARVTIEVAAVSE